MALGLGAHVLMVAAVVDANGTRAGGGGHRDHHWGLPWLLVAKSVGW